jgi:hypothetical protein
VLVNPQAVEINIFVALSLSKKAKILNFKIRRSTPDSHPLESQSILEKCQQNFAQKCGKQKQRTELFME